MHIVLYILHCKMVMFGIFVLQDEVEGMKYIIVYFS
jgi:hypothetical protein